MAHTSSPAHTAASLLDTEPDLVRHATCPMCHASTAMTQQAIEAGGEWRCARCGQHWDVARLAAVAAYAAWVVDRDRGVKVSTHGSQHAHDQPAELQGGRP